MDANSLGTRTLPDDAYAYATGTPIAIYGGTLGAESKTIQIDRPLDFAAVTDHEEWLAEVSLCATPDSRSYDSTGCVIYRGEQDSLLAKALGANGFRARIGGNDELCEFENIRDFGQPELSDCAEGQSKGAQAGKGCASGND